jgi:hypothetical protein
MVFQIVKRQTSSILGAVPALFLMGIACTAQAQSWVEIQTAGQPPAGRFNNTAVFDPVSERLIIFGGLIGPTCCQGTNDVWLLTNANANGGTRQWINLLADNAPGAPPPLAAASAVYDSRTNRMIVFGGQDLTVGKSSGQVWILNNANGFGGPPSWQRLQITPPPARQNHQAFYSSRTNRMIVVGGLSNTASLSLLNDVWALTNANGTDAQPPAWTQLAPTGMAPSPRHAFATAFDAQNDRLTIFGGCIDVSFVCATTSIELWVLANASGKTSAGADIAPAWTKLSYHGDTPIALAQFASTAYNASTNRLFLFGGRIGSNPPFGTFTNFTWVLDHANGVGGEPGWSLTSSGQPPPPKGQSVPPNLFDARTGRWILFGGPATSDAWSRQSR